LTNQLVPIYNQFQNEDKFST